MCFAKANIRCEADKMVLPDRGMSTLQSINDGDLLHADIRCRGATLLKIEDIVTVQNIPVFSIKF